MSSVIRTEKVWKVFGADSPRRVEAVRDISLTIEKGLATAIGGPSGSGKTTLLSLMGLLSKPSKGSVFFNDRELTGLSEVFLAGLRRNEIGFIFQAQYLMPQLTALENVTLPKVCTDTPLYEAEEVATKLLTELGLEQRLNFRIAELSGGEQQRVSIARALMNEPSILIADEPSASIDEKLANELLSTLREMIEEANLTVILASHDPVVLEWADRVFWMRDGQLIDKD